MVPKLLIKIIAGVCPVGKRVDRSQLSGLGMRIAARQPLECKMRVRLTRKLANCLDGVDVSDRQVGEVIDLAPREARLLVAEEWAVPVPGTVNREVRFHSAGGDRRVAADSHRRTAAGQLRHISRQIVRGQFEPSAGRRAEDWVVEDIRESRTRTARPKNE